MQSSDEYIEKLSMLVFMLVARSFLLLFDTKHISLAFMFCYWKLHVRATIWILTLYGVLFITLRTHQVNTPGMLYADIYTTCCCCCIFSIDTLLWYSVYWLVAEKLDLFSATATVPNKQTEKSQHWLGNLHLTLVAL